MSLAGRMLLQTRRAQRRFLSTWWRISFVSKERCRLRCLQLGPRNVFNVPVRSFGSGSLCLGADNMLGYLRAPRLGNGEILLQPRDTKAFISIGDHNAFSNNVSLVAMEKIVIGNECLIGGQVTITDCDFHEISPLTRKRSVGLVRPVTIGNNVWLGERVMVLKGASIGDNSVVAAMSVVTKPVPANCIAAGNPAKVIRQIG